MKLSSSSHINRTASSSTRVVGKSQWSTAVHTLWRTKTCFDITCAASVSDDKSEAEKPDASKLSKVVGPGRYPAFVPDESLLGPSTPPELTEEDEASSALSAFTRRRSGSLFTSSGAGGVGGAIAARRAAESKTGRVASAAPVDPATVILKSEHWSDLAPVIELGSALSGRMLLAAAERLTSLGSTFPPDSETQLNEMVKIGEKLTAASRVFISGNEYSPEQIAKLMQAIGTMRTSPGDNWMFAAEMACRSGMTSLRKAQTARDLDDLTAARSDVAFVQGVLAVVANMVSIDYKPREDWIQLLIEITQPVLTYLSYEADQYMIAEAAKGGPASTYDIKKAAKGLIKVPEQVITAEGEEVDMLKGWESVPQMGQVEWAGLAQCIMAWRPEIGDDWMQTYIDASYGAMVATGRLITQSLDDNKVEEEERVPLAARVLDSSVLADVATSMAVSGVKPGHRWAEALSAASAAVFTRILKDNESQTVTGFTARPNAVVNLVLILQEFGGKIDQKWVESALMACSAGKLDAQGDTIAGLLYHTGELGHQVEGVAVRGATVIAGQALELWDDQEELERQQRLKQKQAAARGGQDEGDGPELIPEDTTGFSPTGLVMLGAGLARFNALQLMPTRWLQAYYDQLSKRADEFDQVGVLMILEAAAKSGINIPPRTLNMVAGHRLERIARAVLTPASTPASISKPSTEKGEDGDDDEAATDGSPATFFQLLDSLSDQQVQLPSAWLPTMQQIMARHIHKAEPEDLLNMLQVIGLIPDGAESDFLSLVMDRFRELGGLSSPEGCLAMSQGLVAAGAEEQFYQAVEEAALECVPRAISSSDTTVAASAPLQDPSMPASQIAAIWTALIGSMCVGGYAPSEAFWQRLDEATPDMSALPLPVLCDLLSSFGTLRAMRGEDVDTGREVVEKLIREAVQRVKTVGQNQEDLVVLVGCLAAQMINWPDEICVTFEQACLPFGSDLQLSIVTACTFMFERCAHDPSPEWCSTAVEALTGQIQAAAPQELVLYMKALSELQNLRAATPSSLVNTLIEVAGKKTLENQMNPSQISAFIKSTCDLVRSCGYKGVTLTNATPAASALMEKSLAMREMMATPELNDVCLGILPSDAAFKYLRLTSAFHNGVLRADVVMRMQITSSLILGLRPSARWCQLMLATLEGRELAEAGSRGLATLTTVLDNVRLQVPPGLLQSLVAVLPKLTGSALEAAGLLDQAKAQILGEQNQQDGVQGVQQEQDNLPPVQVIIENLDALIQAAASTLHYLVNASSALPVKDRARIGGEDNIVWQHLAALLEDGLVSSDLHDSILYAAARSTNLGSVKDVTDDGEDGIKADSPAGIIAGPALVATSISLPMYDQRQLFTVFSTLASMRIYLPNDWLERFWEYSRTKVATCPVDMLIPAVSALSAVTEQGDVSIPQIWQEALLARLQGVAEKMSLQKITVILTGLATAGIRPPEAVLQSLLDTALSQQQSSAAQLAQLSASTSKAGGSDSTKSSSAADGGDADSQSQQQAALAAGSTRARRGAAAPGNAPSGSAPPPGSLRQALANRAATRGQTTTGNASSTSAAAAPKSSADDAVASRAAAVSAAQQSLLFVSAMQIVQGQFGYSPDESWMMQAQAAIQPSLSSSLLTAQERQQIARDLQSMRQQ